LALRFDPLQYKANFGRMRSAPISSQSHFSLVFQCPDLVFDYAKGQIPKNFQQFSEKNLADFLTQQVNPRDAQRIWTLVEQTLSNTLTQLPEVYIELLGTTRERYYKVEIICACSLSKHLEFVTLHFTKTFKQLYHYKHHLEGLSSVSSIVEHTTDLVLAIDAYGRVISCNQTARQFMEKNFQVSIKQKGKFPNTVQTNHFIFDLLKRKVAQAFSGSSFETELMLGNEQTQYYTCSFNPIKDPFDHILGVVIFGRNITSMKMIENELLLMRNELSQVVHRSSHDLRSPVNTMQGIINLIRKDFSEQSALIDYINMMDQSLQKLDLYTRDINQYAQTLLHATIQKVDFHAIFSDIIRSLSYLPGNEKVNKFIIINDNIGLYTDSSKLKLIFNALISNALKYYRPYTTDAYYKIIINNYEDYSFITFEDNGQGISDEFHNIIFDMYVKGSDNSNGAGLGLYMVKKAVQALEGTIEMVSELDKGTTFQIKIKNHLNRYNNAQ